MFLVTTASSILSILGSSAIVYMILFNSKKKLGRPKNRLMLMMSFFDILASLALAISRLAMPSDIGVRGAVGNSFTCTAQGICVWLGFAVPFYNSSLNLFYLLSIKYSMNHDDFSKKIEPFLHLISISIPVSFATIFAVRGEIVPSGNVCFGNSRNVAVTLACTTSFCILFCIFSMTSICWAVAQRAKKMRSYSTYSIINRSRILEITETRK